MASEEDNLRVLDAAYKPFPTFAVWNRAHTKDFSRWERETALLKERAGSSSGVLDRARAIATRAAAIDTGALENLYEADRGFTYSVAFETSGWELAVAARGEQVRPLFEAQLQAYEYVLSLATGAEPISEAAIRELHVQMCAAQATYLVETAVGPREQTMPKGVYKSLPNHVRTRHGQPHSYAPVDVTPGEMYRLTLELRTEEFLAAHPMVQAAYAHYCFVLIHPFADGNGRVARGLASAYSYRAISIPIVIFSEQKSEYLDALEKADGGEFEAFTNFLMGRSSDTAELVGEALLAPKQDAIRAAQEVDTLFVAAGMSQKDVEALGDRVTLIVAEALGQSGAPFRASGNMRVTVMRLAGQLAPPAQGYRPSESAPLQASVSTIQPAAAERNLLIYTLLPKLAKPQSYIRFVDSVGRPLLAFRIEQLYPILSPVVLLRCELFAERLWAQLLTELRPLAEAALTDR